MDTRFWGPSGWRFLHSVTFSYELERKNAFRRFFEALPFVLPCKFCRTSLQEYMEVDPVDPALDSKESLCRWLWRIHNKVNSKLRSQGQPVDPDPPFEKVKAFYEDLLAAGCAKTEFPGWDFLFSIADLHPLSSIVRKSVPMAGYSDAVECKTVAEKNKWNCMTPEERMVPYGKFWNSIQEVLPFKEWRAVWSKYADSKTKTKKKTISWLWSQRCAVEKELNLINRCKFSSLCKTLRVHRSGCSKSKRARTCRKKKN